MSIEFTNGFSIVPVGAAPPGIGVYYLHNQYAPANAAGQITIPNHGNSTPSLDFNIVNENTNNAIYINYLDSVNTDNTTYLSQLIGNHTHLTFTQNNYHITFDCTVNAWYDGDVVYSNQIYYDPQFGQSQSGSITIVSTSGVTFNAVDPVSISIEII